MIQWNAEEQITSGLDVERCSLIDRGIMFGRGNPAGVRLDGRRLHDLMHDLYAIRARFRRAG